MIRDPDFGITGYTDRWAYRPGDAVSLHLSSTAECTASARLHRFRQYVPKDPCFDLVTEEVAIDGSEFPVTPQRTRLGSCFEVSLPRGIDWRAGITLAVLVLPTAVEESGNGLLDLAGGAGGLALSVHPGGTLCLSSRGGADNAAAIELREALPIGRWGSLCISCDPAEATIWLSVRTAEGIRSAEAAMPADFLGDDMDLTLAASGAQQELPTFNGRLEAPILWRDALDPREAFECLDAFADGVASLGANTIAAWDFSRQMDSSVVEDAGPYRCLGRLVNLPMRAVKGTRWSGSEQSWKHAPRDYASIHFHQDDLLDARWKRTAVVQLPDSLDSGLYFVEIEGGAGRDVLPIFVTPKVRGRRSKLAWVAPTFTYLAYTNDRCLLHGANPEVLANRLLVLTPGDCHLAEHPEYGLSLYDTHADGTGVAYASRRRPCLSFRHSQRAWQGGIGSSLWNFAADLLILSWLDREGLEYEIVTDDELDRDGARGLDAYTCVLTGSHPEYHTTGSHDAFCSFVDGGGRLIYLGGNGFYWRVSTHGGYPETIELRRAEDGNRSWASEPGEYYHAFDSAYGGLWRRNGRPPQKLLGVGYTGQGFFRCHPYEFSDDCRDARASFLFDELPEVGKPLGDAGQVGGGAAGIEIDRADKSLGTPTHSLILATCDDFNDSYVLANEEVLVNRPNVIGHLTPLLRADLVFFETPAGGAVLSTGSVAWAGSLGDLPEDNDVARLTRRAVDRFLDPEPFYYPSGSAGEKPGGPLPNPRSMRT